MAWNQSTKTLVPVSSQLEHPAIFLSSYDNSFYACGVKQADFPAPNQWHDLDLTPLGVPTNALAVLLIGFMIITDGSGTGIADLAAAFQAPGGPFTPASYCEQTMGTTPSGGARTIAPALVPCVNGAIEWAWLRGDNSKAGEWPDGPLPAYPVGATYGLNICVAQVFMP